MRRGFSLIELIFAIVVIGISVAALPRVVQQTQRSNEFALKQELILNAKTMVGNIIKEMWDSSALNQKCTSDGDSCTDVKSVIMAMPIYNIPLGGTDGNRVGIVAMPTAVASRADRAPNLASSNWQAATKAKFSNSYGPSERNDIDDYDGVKFDMSIAPDLGDFLTQTTIAVTVDFVNQNLATGNYRNSRDISINLSSDPASISAVTTNIKRVIVTATDRNNNRQQVVLVAYSFNIGDTPAIYRRSWVAPPHVPPSPPAPGGGA